MWTVDSGQGSDPLRGTNAPLANQAEVASRQGPLVLAGGLWVEVCKVISPPLSLPHREVVFPNWDIWKPPNLSAGEKLLIP